MRLSRVFAAFAAVFFCGILIVSCGTPTESSRVETSGSWGDKAPPPAPSPSPTPNG